MHQVNVTGMENLVTLGVHSEPYFYAAYGAGHLARLLNLSIRNCYTGLGFGYHENFPNSQHGTLIEFPPNLVTFDFSANPRAHGLSDVPASVQWLNISGTGIDTIDEINSNESDKSFPELITLSMQSCPIANLQGIASKMPV